MLLILILFFCSLRASIQCFDMSGSAEVSSGKTPYLVSTIAGSANDSM